MWNDYKDRILKDKKLDDNWYIIGIDLGTTHSVISYINSTMDRPEPFDISNGFGKVPMPSVVQYRKEGFDEEWVVGEEALRSMKIYPEHTITSIKKHMGSDARITLGGNDYLPEEISAMILKNLIREMSNINPRMELIGVVVSVPYDFDDSARKATIRACQLAGLSDSLICLIEEPKAALLAYNFSHELYHNEKIMVFDFGGGTLDITIFQVTKDNNRLLLKVLSEGGDGCHGGDDVDRLLIKEMLMYLEENSISKDAISIENHTDIYLRAIEVKERLSGVKKYRIPFTFCVPPFIKEITRERFEIILEGFIKRTRQLVLNTLKESYDGAIQTDDISRVLLEGGSSKMPWVREMLLSIFNDEEKIYASEKPALDISIGATYYAAMKMGILEHTDLIYTENKIDFEVSLPHDIGFEIELEDKKVFHKMIGRGTPYPLAVKSQVFTLRGDNVEDMTSFKLRILERINKGDKIKDCRIIGEVMIKGLTPRPSGKTRLKITLMVEEDGGIVKGKVKDLGYYEEFEASDFEMDFEPKRYNQTVIDAIK